MRTTGQRPIARAAAVAGHQQASSTDAAPADDRVGQPRRSVADSVGRIAELGDLVIDIAGEPGLTARAAWPSHHGNRGPRRARISFSPVGVEPVATCSRRARVCATRHFRRRVRRETDSLLHDATLAWKVLLVTSLDVARGGASGLYRGASPASPHLLLLPDHAEEQRTLATGQ